METFTSFAISKNSVDEKRGRVVEIAAKYMSVKHTAQYLDTPVSTVYEWITSKVIPDDAVVHIGGRILVNRERLDILLAGKQQGNAESLSNKVHQIYNELKSNPAFHARKG